VAGGLCLIVLRRIGYSAEPDQRGGKIGALAGAHCRTQAVLAALPGTSADRMLRAVLRLGGIVKGRIHIIRSEIPIGQLFQDIAGHIHNAMWTLSGRKAADRSCISKAIIQLRFDLLRFRIGTADVAKIGLLVRQFLVPPRIKPAVCAACGFLPHRFRVQAAFCLGTGCTCIFLREIKYRVNVIG
jgi:hypothetical protein